VACPVMYFRPALAMTRFLERLPADPTPRPPAFLLVTCGGEPGATLPLLRELLGRKGHRLVGAHWLPAPDSWPPARRPVAPLAALTGPVRYVLKLLGDPWMLRLLAGIPWPEAAGPVAADREALDGFIDHLAVALSTGNALPAARAPDGTPPFNALGRRVTPEIARRYTAPTADPGRCIRCGTCVTGCPEGCITLADGAPAPRFGDACTGCWACFNSCPTGAISGWLAPHGAGQYHGPSPQMRALLEE